MGRVDLFTPIHKALRAATYDCAASLQCADMTDATEAEQSLHDVERTLEMVEDHRDHEEELIFPAIRDHEPELVGALHDEHEEIGRLVGGVTAAVEATRAARDDASRILAGDELNRRFNELVAAYLAHFAGEETTLVAATQRHLDDGQLTAIREQIVGSLPPELAAEELQWMLRSLNRAELAGLLAGMKATMPAPVFQDIATNAERVMGAERWAAVGRDIGLSQDRAA